jgi:hypothetical protein
MNRSAVALWATLVVLCPSPAWSQGDGGAAQATASDQVNAPPCSGSYSLLHPEPRSCVGPIDTDRPHLTDTPHTIPAGHFQFEAGVVAFGTRRGADVPQSLELMDLLVKTGLVPGVEFQVGYGGLLLDDSSSGWEAHGGASVLVRAKLNLFGGNEPMSLTLAPTVWIPTTSNAGWQGGATLLFGAELPAGLDLEVNLGSSSEATEGRGRRWVVVPSLALTRLLGGPLSAFVESNHQIRIAAPSTWLAVSGLLLRLGRSMQADAGVQLGLTGPEHPVTGFLGYSLRI